MKQFFKWVLAIAISFQYDLFNLLGITIEINNNTIAMTTAVLLAIPFIQRKSIKGTVPFEIKDILFAVFILIVINGIWILSIKGFMTSEFLNQNQLLLEDQTKYMNQLDLERYPVYLYLFLGIVVAPVFEELIYRVMLINRASKRSFLITSFISTTFFILGHFPLFMIENLGNFVQYFGLLVLAVGYCIIYYYYGFWGSLTAHLLTNLINLFSHRVEENLFLGVFAMLALATIMIVGLQVSFNKIKILISKH